MHREIKVADVVAVAILEMLTSLRLHIVLQNVGLADWCFVERIRMAFDGIFFIIDWKTGFRNVSLQLSCVTIFRRGRYDNRHCFVS